MPGLSMVVFGSPSVPIIVASISISLKRNESRSPELLSIRADTMPFDSVYADGSSTKVTRTAAGLL